MHNIEILCPHLNIIWSLSESGINLKINYKLKIIKFRKITLPCGFLREFTFFERIIALTVIINILKTITPPTIYTIISKIFKGLKYARNIQKV